MRVIHKGSSLSTPSPLSQFGKVLFLPISYRGGGAFSIREWGRICEYVWGRDSFRKGKEGFSEEVAKYSHI